MPQYTAPLRDMQFVMHEVLDVVPALRELPSHADVDADLINQVCEEAGKFCAEVLFPINLSGDGEGCHYDPSTHAVTTPKGYKDAWVKYVDAGWPLLTAAPEYGGQGLPHLVGSAVHEMENAANQAWTMYPGLTQGVVELLSVHGSREQKDLYLPKLASGQWTGTMCLTEPHCGTDLGLIRSKAEPQDGGAYTLHGQKIFISSGEHDLAENIVHMVLAKLPGAPEGSKGISLFVVPKIVPDDKGNLGARNGIFCSGIEHKMGIHGNSTCQMTLDGAIGWLVGEPNKGLAAMFVMMNGARLGVGMQSLGLTEVAYQNALAYAKDRLQMRALTGPKAPDKPADPIIVHPDVRRALLTARAWAEGGRFLAYWVALMLDQAHLHPDAEVRKDADDLVALLTPIVKAFITDNGFAAANECLQVFGGHGYIHEWGMEQYVRDARINLIYEGTNAIQALDLIGRKVLMDNGARLKKFGRVVQDFIEAEGVNEAMQEFVNPLADLGDKVQKLTMELGLKAMQNREEIGAAAVPYLRVVGHLVFAYAFARMALVAQQKIAAGSTDAFYTAKLQTARFYFARLYPETAAAIRMARSGARSLMDTEAVFA
ncbi:acyl-CoA dehydrogenase C-terminal domain-containing protein [Thiomonas sp. FB-Cd]|uniref:acyl-CoA dehydrogenase C-terminal domain-containing protein n=1 Tax=Thiomonas sp. FB-Cd TaxID=1158292 RepID=UPI0004DF5426|nr:acyl-CoA dehydrogenase C-terminal domain-containing protein [Thiomonas sp. FB-Cd]